MTHWKKLTNPDYIGSWAFDPGQEIVATISGVNQQDVIGSDGKKEVCTIVHFAEPIKPLILNTTNAKAISKVAKSEYIEDWVGHKIQLYVERVRAFGETVDAVRVRPTKPKPVQEIPPCQNCGQALKPAFGKELPALMEYSIANTGRVLCASCLKEAAAARAGGDQA
ncbi:MAG: hypothetical protein IJ206_13065 [Oscillospiraceae bacterium]|nr:hypothetical protein [Oscillospiraceae bacterium]